MLIYFIVKFQPNGQAPVSSTNKRIEHVPPTHIYKLSPPRRLDIGEMASLVNDYRVAAKNAMEAGTKFV